MAVKRNWMGEEIFYFSHCLIDLMR